MILRKRKYAPRTAGGQHANTRRILWIVTFACVLMLSSGAAYRIVAAWLHTELQKPIELQIPLQQVPTVIDAWTGRDVPLSDEVLKVAGNDDYLNRLYQNHQNGDWANVYVAYTGRPRTMLGHRPQICYPAAGWIHQETKPLTIRSKNGRHVPCLIHEFQYPGSEIEKISVLNFYILNGQAIAKESGFSGIGWRRPNLKGQVALYVSQIQISSTRKRMACSFAEDFIDLIFDYFPDQNGQVHRTSRKD